MSKRLDWNKAKPKGKPTRNEKNTARLEHAADNFLEFGKLYKPKEGTDHGTTNH